MCLRLDAPAGRPRRPGCRTQRVGAPAHRPGIPRGRADRRPRRRLRRTPPEQGRGNPRLRLPDPQRHRHPGLLRQADQPAGDPRSAGGYPRRLRPRTPRTDPADRHPGREAARLQRQVRRRARRPAGGGRPLQRPAGGYRRRGERRHGDGDGGQRDRHARRTYGGGFPRPDRGPRQCAAQAGAGAPATGSDGELERITRQRRDPPPAVESRADRRRLQGQRGRRHRRSRRGAPRRAVHRSLQRPAQPSRGGPQPARRQPVPRTDGVAEARRIRLRRARRRRVFLQGFRLRARWHLRSGPTAPVRRHHQLPRPRLPAPVGRLRRRHAGVPRDGDLRRPRQPAFRSGLALDPGVARAAPDRPGGGGIHQLRAGLPDARGIPGAAAANGRGTGRPGRGCPAAVAAGLVPEEFPDRGSSVPPSSCSWRSSSSRTAWCDGRA
ncbi:Uncharacterised protein [Pseudomonas aeruginosa]|nr:Uncharacterised protein [Pseudomonas aeruginosa]